MDDVLLTRYTGSMVVASTAYCECRGTLTKFDEEFIYIEPRLEARICTRTKEIIEHNKDQVCKLPRNIVNNIRLS